VGRGLFWGITFDKPSKHQKGLLLGQGHSGVFFPLDTAGGLCRECMQGHPVCGSKGLRCIGWMKHMQNMFSNWLLMRVPLCLSIAATGQLTWKQSGMKSCLLSCSVLPLFC